MKELLIDARFALTFFAMAILFGIMGLLEIKRRNKSNKNIGYVLIYTAAALLFISLLLFFYINYEPVPIWMIIRHY